MGARFVLLLVVLFSLKVYGLSENEKLNVKATPQNLKRVPKDAAELIMSLPDQRIKMDRKRNIIVHPLTSAIGIPTVAEIEVLKAVQAYLHDLGVVWHARLL